MNGFTKLSSVMAIVVAALTIGSAAQAASGNGARASAWSQRKSALPTSIAGRKGAIPRPPGVETRGKGQSVRTFLEHRRGFDGYNGRPGTAGLAVCDHYQNVIKTYLPGGNNGWGYVVPVAGFADYQRVIVRATSNLPNGAGGWRPDSYADWSSSSSPGSWGFNAWWLGNQAFPYQAYVPFPLRGWGVAIVVYEFWWIDQSNPNHWLYDYDLRQCQQWL